MEFMDGAVSTRVESEQQNFEFITIMNIFLLSDLSDMTFCAIGLGHRRGSQYQRAWMIELESTSTISRPPHALNLQECDLVHPALDST